MEKKSNIFQGLLTTLVQLFQGPFPKHSAALLEYAATQCCMEMPSSSTSQTSPITEGDSK